MMTKYIVHKAGTRGHANHGWLNSYQSFSFAGYYNPERVHFGALRVLNDDVVEGGKGFGLHPHDNMEIISIPLQGALAPGNQPWTKQAAALVVSVGIKELPDSQQKNTYYLHDAGMFHSFMLLQAQSMDIYGHLMAGFDKHKLALLLDLPVTEEVVSVIALGYTDVAEKLQEPYKTREISPRSRKPLAEFTALLN